MLAALIIPLRLYKDYKAVNIKNITENLICVFTTNSKFFNNNNTQVIKKVIYFTGDCVMELSFSADKETAFSFSSLEENFC